MPTHARDPWAEVHAELADCRAGGISFTRADDSEVGVGAGSGGNLRTAADFEAALSGLTMYPQVSCSACPWAACSMLVDVCLAGRCIGAA